MQEKLQKFYSFHPQCRTDPEPNVQKNIFSITYPFFMGCSKLIFFRKTFYELFHILVAQSTARPMTPCTRRTNQNSWRSGSPNIEHHSKISAQLLLNTKICSSRSPAFPKRFLKFSMPFFLPPCTDIIILNEK